MPTQVQFRRGTTTQNNAFTGAQGELSVSTTDYHLRVHDGSTQGGKSLLLADLTNVTGDTDFFNRCKSGKVEVVKSLDAISYHCGGLETRINEKKGIYT